MKSNVIRFARRQPLSHPGAEPKTTHLLAQQPTDTLLHLPLHLTRSQRQARTLIHTSEEIRKLNDGLLAKDGQLSLGRPIGKVGALVRGGVDTLGASSTTFSSTDALLDRTGSSTSPTSAERFRGPSGEAAAAALTGYTARRRVNGGRSGRVGGEYTAYRLNRHALSRGEVAARAQNLGVQPRASARLERGPRSCAEHSIGDNTAYT